MAIGIISASIYDRIATDCRDDHAMRHAGTDIDHIVSMRGDLGGSQQGRRGISLAELPIGIVSPYPQALIGIQCQTMRVSSDDPLDSGEGWDQE